MSTYQQFGRCVYLVHAEDDKRLSAECSSSSGAFRATCLLNRARTLNDVKRKYTAAARLIEEAEAIDGFHWLAPV